MLHLVLVEDNPADVLMVREALRASAIPADVMPALVDVDTMGQPIDSLSREERVHRRAQELYRLRGDQPGSVIDDWLRAEEVPKSEQSMRLRKTLFRQAIRPRAEARRGKTS